MTIDTYKATVHFDNFTFTSDVQDMMNARARLAKALGCDMATMPMMLDKRAVFAIVEHYGYNASAVFKGESGVCDWSHCADLDTGMGIQKSGNSLLWFPQAVECFIHRLELHGAPFKGSKATRKSSGKRWSWSATFQDNNWGDYDSKAESINVQLIIPKSIATLYSGSLKVDALNLLVENINKQLEASKSIATFLTENN